MNFKDAILTSEAGRDRAPVHPVEERSSVLRSGIDGFLSTIWSTDQQPSTQNRPAERLAFPSGSSNAAEFLKTAALFLPGRIGVASTIALHALDAVDPRASSRTQCYDGMLGALKGATLRGSFAAADRIGAGPAAKGLLLGATSRFSESAFERDTFTKMITGSAPLTAGERISRLCLTRRPPVQTL